MRATPSNPQRLGLAAFIALLVTLLVAPLADTQPRGGINPGGRPGAPGAAGPAPSGTGLVSVTSGVLDTPSTLRARTAADATNLRTDLGLGNSATRAVGTTTGTVCAGDDSRVTGAVQASTLTTNGDLLYRTGGAPARLAIGSTGYALGVVAGAPAWALPSSLVTASGDASAMRTALGLTSAPSLSSTSLVVDLDADAGITIATGVSAWASQVGTFVAAQATGSKQPTVVTVGFNGHNAIRCDGSNDLLVIPHEAALDWSTLTVYVVARALRNSSAALSGSGMVVGRGFNLAHDSPYYEWVILHLADTTAFATTDGTSIITAGFPWTSAWDNPTIMTLSVGAGGGSLHYRGQRVGSTATTSITYANSMNVAICGGSRTTEAEFFRGDITRVLIYSVQHTAAQRAAVEDYLSQRYGIPVVVGLTI